MRQVCERRLKAGKKNLTGALTLTHHIGSYKTEQTSTLFTLICCVLRLCLCSAKMPKGPPGQETLKRDYEAGEAHVEKVYSDMRETPGGHIHHIQVFREVREFRKPSPERPQRSPPRRR